MVNNHAPYDKLQLFQDKIGLGAEEFEILKPFRTIFTKRKHEFAEYFHEVFSSITETRRILEHERKPGLMKTMWARWFESVFSSDMDTKFLGYLWHIGVRHVEIDLDQRFSNLGFSAIRQFCQRLILSKIPSDKVGPVLVSVDKLLDLCLLVETSAYIERTTRCDMEVIRSVADRVRNPAVVIGGNIKRLQKNVPADSKEYKVYEKLIGENRRFENMFKDIRVYVEAFSSEPELRSVDLRAVISSVLNRLTATGALEGIKVDVALDQSVDHVLGDRKELECLFFYLIQNAAEATNKRNPYVRISSSLEEVIPQNVLIQIFNSGTPPAPEEIDQFFSPFYSTKRSGTGFGLPIARVIARKHFGSLVMEPVPGEGARVTVSLRASD